MIKRLFIFGLIGIFLLSGCEQIKELYGIQPSTGDDYIPLEEIQIKGEDNLTPEAPLTLPKGEIPAIEEITKEAGELPEESVGAAGKEKSKGEAKVLIVEETDLVSLKPKATDPDKDKLVFSYTTPLDEEGKWQTTYGNAGEYTVTLTASDGDLSVTKDVLIIVKKKEEAPVIKEAIPKEDTLKANENSKLEFSVTASDLNKDPLTYSWKLDGAESSKDKSYTYNIGYDDAGQHTVKVVVSDGVKDASKIWAVSVENVNRKPVLEKIADIKTKENGIIVLEPKAADPDNDPLAFSIDSDKFKKTDNRFEWKTTYDDAGEYSVTVTVSDGKDEVSQKIKITVENVNRPPVIEDVILG